MPRELTLLELAERGILPYDWDRRWSVPTDPTAYSPTPEEVLGTNVPDTKEAETPTTDDDHKTR